MQNPREEVRNINPTLLIGLGGTGREVLTRVRRDFVQKYDNIRNFPIVGYFLVDTDETSQHYTPGLKSLLDQKIDFSQDEFYKATITNVSQFTQRLNLYPHIAEWLYPNLSDIGDLKEGAGAIRPYGRLAFFVHQRNIRTNITNTLKSIRSPENISIMAEKHNINCGNSVSAYIVCSIAGGTGSSMFLDMAFTLKDITKAEGMSIEIIGFLVMPGLYGKDSHAANGYAALKELEHHSRINNFDVQYENNTNRKTIPVPPFDYCYLIHSENEGNVPVDFNTREDMFELVSENIFLDFSNDDFAAHKRRIRVNFTDQLAKDVYTIGNVNIGSGMEEEGWSRRYMSFGYTSISYPADRIISCCAYKLAAEVFNDWGKLADSQGQIAGGSLADYVYNAESSNTGFFSDLGMYESLGAVGKHDLLNSITRKGTGNTLFSDISSWANGLEKQVKDDNHLRDNMTVVQFLDQNVKLFEAKFIDESIEPDPTKHGEYVQVMNNNINVLLEGGLLAGTNESIDGLCDHVAKDGSVTHGKIYKYVAKMINDKTLSSAQIRQVLGEVVKRLGTGNASYKAAFLEQTGDEQSKTGMYKELEQYQGQMNQYKNNIDSYLRERDDHNSWPDRMPWSKIRKIDALRYDDAHIFGVLHSYVESLIQYLQIKTRILARRKLLKVCNQLIDYTTTLIKELDSINITISKLHSQAMTVSDDFRGRIPVNLLQNIYDPDDIESIYYPMAEGFDNIDYHSRMILDRLTQVFGDGRQITIADIPDLVETHSPERIMGEVISYTRSIYEPIIKQLSIIDGVYVRKYPEALAEKRKLFLYNTLKYGKCWMVLNDRLPNLRLSPDNNRSYIVGRVVDPAKQQARMLFDKEIQGMRDTAIDPTIQIFQTTDPSKILISTELAGFPLAAFNGINALKEKYDAVYMEPGSTLHINKDDSKYRDISPMINVEDIEKLNDIRSCFVLGVILGVIVPRIATIGNAKMIVFDFNRMAILETVTRTLGIESKAKVALEKNETMLREIKGEIARKEGMLLRQKGGKFNPDNFRKYFMTLFWYWKNIYPEQNVDMGSGQAITKRSPENLILDRKMHELQDLYKESFDPGEAESQWSIFTKEARVLLNEPDVFSDLIGATNFRVVKMQDE